MKEKAIIDQATKVFQKGGIVIFPTDTVWGIGVSIDQPQAIQKLYQIKKREKTKPTAVLVGSLVQAQQLGEINKKAESLIKKYWPGGLTIVIKAKKGIPRVIQGKGGTVGLRMPDHKLILKILTKLEKGIVASSANFAGQPLAVKRELIDQQLIEMVDLFIKGKSKRNLASTVIDLTKKPFKISRKGVIASEKLKLL